MAEVRAFRGLRYATSEANTSLTNVICPPFDVITPTQQQALEERSQHNAVRIELPRGDGEERYANAARLFFQ